jgi:lipid-binding SYLF domain-containing protein
MDNRATNLKKIKTNKVEIPRQSIIKALLNYSKSIQIIGNSFSTPFVFLNN